MKIQPKPFLYINLAGGFYTFNAEFVMNFQSGNNMN